MANNISNESMSAKKGTTTKSYCKIPNEQRNWLIRLVYEQGHNIKESAEILGIRYLFSFQL